MWISFEFNKKNWISFEFNKKCEFGYKDINNFMWNN